MPSKSFAPFKKAIRVVEKWGVVLNAIAIVLLVTACVIRFVTE